MHVPKQTLSHWSGALAEQLVACLECDRVFNLAQQFARTDAKGNGSASCAELRTLLMQTANDDVETRTAILDGWRQEHPEIIHAADLISADAPLSAALVYQFGAVNVLLELISDPYEDGWLLAQSLVEQLPDEALRRKLQSVLRRWSDSGAQKPQIQTEQRYRIAVFGGRVRDESKMTQRLFEDSPLDVSWQPWEKGKKPDGKTLADAVASSDAVIVVTAMVSHHIMWTVKRFAREKGIPWKPVPKATDMHLKEAISELFPDVAQALG